MRCVLGRCRCGQGEKTAWWRVRVHVLLSSRPSTAVLGALGTPRLASLRLTRGFLRQLVLERILMPMMTLRVLLPVVEGAILLPSVLITRVGEVG